MLLTLVLNLNYVTPFTNEMWDVWEALKTISASRGRWRFRWSSRFWRADLLRILNHLPPHLDDQFYDRRSENITKYRRSVLSVWHYWMLIDFHNVYQNVLRSRWKQSKARKCCHWMTLYLLWFIQMPENNDRWSSKIRVARGQMF